MKLIIAVIQNEDEDGLVQELEQHNIGATRIGSSGGFLRASNMTLLIAVNDDQVDAVLEYLKKHCKRRTRHLHPLLPNLEARERFLGTIPVEVGGAIVFVLPVERMQKID
ncbi:MAG TPA: cyclic-di-AMP receptor [Anaerolineae bacterium]|nr:cyclic-di-AMP receptor [Anaerolineae bacterium]